MVDLGELRFSLFTYMLTCIVHDVSGWLEVGSSSSISSVGQRSIDRSVVENLNFGFISTCQHLRCSCLYLQILGTNHHADSSRILHLLGRRAKKPVGAEAPVQVCLDSITYSLDILIHRCSSRAFPMRQTSGQFVEAFQTCLEQTSEVIERFLGTHSPTAASCNKVVSHILGLGAGSVNEPSRYRNEGYLGFRLRWLTHLFFLVGENVVLDQDHIQS
jgi:hypothetical protein